VADGVEAPTWFWVAIAGAVVAAGAALVAVAFNFGTQLAWVGTVVTWVGSALTALFFGLGGVVLVLAVCALVVLIMQGILQKAAASKYTIAVLPAFVSLTSGLLLTVSNEVLADEPVVKFAIGAVLALATFLTVALRTAGRTTAARVFGSLAIALPLGVVAVGVVTTPWRATFASLPLFDQALLVLVPVLYVSASLWALLPLLRRRASQEPTSTAAAGRRLLVRS
jgi:hypothetical protein